MKILSFFVTFLENINFKQLKNFTVNLTLCSKRQIDGENFVNFCGLLRKHELYLHFFYFLPLWTTVRLLRKKLHNETNIYVCTYQVSGHGLKQWNCEKSNKTCKIFSNFSLCTNCFMTKHAFLAKCAKYGAKCKRLPIKSILQYWN